MIQNILKNRILFVFCMAFLWALIFVIPMIGKHYRYQIATRSVSYHVSFISRMLYYDLLFMMMLDYKDALLLWYWYTTENYCDIGIPLKITVILVYHWKLLWYWYTTENYCDIGIPLKIIVWMAGKSKAVRSWCCFKYFENISLDFVDFLQTLDHIYYCDIVMSLKICVQVAGVWKGQICNKKYLKRTSLELFSFCYSIIFYFFRNFNIDNEDNFLDGFHERSLKETSKRSDYDHFIHAGYILYSRKRIKYCNYWATESLYISKRLIDCFYSLRQS